MDVKEINNALNPAMAFGRVSSQAVAGQGFAGLIAQTGDLSAELMSSLSGEKNGSPVEARASQPKNRGLENIRSDSRADKAKKTAEKSTAPEKKNSDRKRRVSAQGDEAQNAPEQKMEAEKAPRLQNDEAVAGNTPVAADNEAVAETVGISEDAAASGIIAVSGQDETVDASLESVSLQNAEIQEGTSGLEAGAAQMSKNESPFDALLQEMTVLSDGTIELEAGDVDFTALPQMNGDEEIEAAVENITSSHNVKENTVENGNFGEYEMEMGEELRAQSAELSEMLGDKQKLKIDVNVKEEKISYLSGQDLVKNRQALNEAVASLEANGEGVAPTASETQISMAANNNQNVPVAALSVVVPGEEINAAASSAAENNISVGSSQTASAGMANNVLSGAENGRKTSDVSFRDVYKGMSKEVIDQVKVNITKSAVKGVDTINVRLKPEDLGHIEIKMQIKDGKLQAHIISSRPETSEILQKEAAALEKAFNEAGFQTDGDSLNFSFRDEGQAGQNKEKNSDLRNFMGEIFENETAEELEAVSGEYMWNGNRGLNIRV